MGVGDKIYKLRMARNLTQEQFGEKIGVTRQTVSLWEANKREIKADKLKVISEFFGVETGYFFDNNTDSNSAAADMGKEELTIVDCAEYEQSNEPDRSFELMPIKTKSQSKPKNTRVKKAVLITAIIVVLAIGILALFIGISCGGHKDAFGSVSSVTYNFGPESIGWIVFIFAGILALVCVAILIRTKRKGKK